MSTPTANMALLKAVDGDQAKTYLETDLASSLTTLDTHDHSATAKGLPVVLRATTAVVGGGTLTWPTSSDTMVGLATTDSLSNKTLVTPTIAAAGWSNANHTHVGATTGGVIAYSSISGTPATLTFTTIGGYPGATGSGLLVEQTTPTITTPILTRPSLSPNGGNNNDIATDIFEYGTTSRQLPAVASSGGQFRFTKAYGGGLTITSAASNMIVPLGTTPVASFALLNGESVLWYCDGLSWWAI